MIRIKSLTFTLFLIVINLLISSSLVSATTFSIDTSAEWKSFDTEQTNWNTLGFDDSSWRNAYEDYAAHPGSEYVELATAKTIWDWSYAITPSGLNGPLVSYFRYSISLDGPIENALFSYAVDDAMILYINGQVAYTHSGAGNTNTPGYKIIDTSLFVLGENIIAFKAWDGSSSGVYNRGGEALTANFLLNTNPVPEPTTMLLLGTGLIGITGLRKKFIKK